MEKIRNIHPGEILSQDFLMPLSVTTNKLSGVTGILHATITAIINGNRKITADTALICAQYFINSPKFWLGLQNDFDIEERKIHLRKRLSAIPHFQRDTD
jgi:antitoxin HigA-1